MRLRIRRVGRSVAGVSNQLSNDGRCQRRTPTDASGLLAAAQRPRYESVSACNASLIRKRSAMRRMLVVQQHSAAPRSASGNLERPSLHLRPA
jgi:hypothetical protein